MISVTLKIENKQGVVRYSKRNVTRSTLETLQTKIGKWENGYRLKELIKN